MYCPIGWALRFLASFSVWTEEDKDTLDNDLGKRAAKFPLSLSHRPISVSSGDTWTDTLIRNNNAQLMTVITWCTVHVDTWTMYSVWLNAEPFTLITYTCRCITLSKYTYWKLTNTHFDIQIQICTIHALLWKDLTGVGLQSSFRHSMMICWCTSSVIPRLCKWTNSS